jgi:serine/threonine protein kinase/Flp pilus assembly protein TadD
MINQTISHYKILEKLGGGGMGIVYKAQDIKLDRFVALKFLPTGLTLDEEAKQRFIQEAQAASALQHTNICTIHDIDETDDGKLFIVMDCYEGESLKEKIARGPMNIEEAVHITMQIAEGLCNAHEKGIVHRDIKPANILVTNNGVVKIVDFGLAKLSGRTMITKTGHTMGTAAYMSPEQAQSSDVDYRTDIWSLGVVLYEMIAGRRPFESNYDLALMYAILNEDPPPLNHFRQDIPEHILKVCYCCLEKKSESRPQSMDEVVKLLRNESLNVSHTPSKHLLIKKYWKQATFVAVALLMIVVIAMMMKIPQEGTPAFSGKPIFGILPIENTSEDTVTVNWPIYIQWRLFDNFVGRNTVAVFDPVTTNDIMDSSMAMPGGSRDKAKYELTNSTEINLMIDVKIKKFNQGYRIEITASGRMGLGKPYSTYIDISNKNQLVSAVDSLSERLSAVLHLGETRRSEKASINDWHPSKVHIIPAVNAFALGVKMNYRSDPLADTYLERAIQMDWAFIAPRALLIQKLVKHGSLDQAKDHFRILANLRNTASPYEQTFIDWAGALVRADVQGQMQALDILLEYSPGNGFLAYFLARLKYVQWDFNRCVEILTPVLKTRWHYSPMYYLMAASYEQLGRLSEARHLLEQSLSYKPIYPENFSLLSAMCYRDKDSLLATQYERLYIKANKEQGISADDSYATLASLCLERGRDEAASRLYRFAVRQRPNYPPFHQGLGDALLYLGDTLAALREYHHAIALNAQYPEPLYRLSEILEHQRNRKQSLYYTRHYLRLDSAGAHAAEARARLMRLKY